MFDIENDVNTQEKGDAASEGCASEHTTCVDAQTEAKLNVALNELQTFKEKFSRLNADFQNAQKRAELDRVLQQDRLRGDILLGVLSIVDNFDRALEAANQQAATDGAVSAQIAGFQMIHKMLYDWLASQKVTVISQITTFDPHLHEAVMQVSEGDAATGSIVQVFEKGFMYKDTVLRTAKVSVKN